MYEDQQIGAHIMTMTPSNVIIIIIPRSYFIYSVEHVNDFLEMHPLLQLCVK